MLGTEEEDLKEIPGKLRSILLLLPKDEVYQEKLQEKNTDVGVSGLGDQSEARDCVSGAEYVLHTSRGRKCLRVDRITPLGGDGVLSVDQIRSVDLSTTNLLTPGTSSCSWRTLHSRRS